MTGYRPLPFGTVVSFLLRGKPTVGRVVGVDLNPNRKPGIGRVTYEIKFHPAYHPVRRPATRVEPVTP